MTDSGWEPEPAQLRDGEERDDTAHAQATIEQLKVVEESPYVDRENQERARQRRLELEEEIDDED